MEILGLIIIVAVLGGAVAWQRSRKKKPKKGSTSPGDGFTDSNAFKK